VLNKLLTGFVCVVYCSTVKFDYSVKWSRENVIDHKPHIPEKMARVEWRSRVTIFRQFHSLCSV
jgi:hypothetical protein